MKKIKVIFYGLGLVSLFILTACQSQTEPKTSQSSQIEDVTQNRKEEKPMTSKQIETNLALTINGQAIQVDWADNASVTALKELVGENGLTLATHDYGQMEKVADLPQTLPSSNQNMSVDAGDITLYQGTDLSFYYSTNRYVLTPIGKIQGMSKEEIRQLLTSQDSPEITLTLVEVNA